MAEYAVYADDQGRWVLYEVGGGNFNVVGWFPENVDAERCMAAWGVLDELWGLLRPDAGPTDYVAMIAEVGELAKSLGHLPQRGAHG